LHELRQRVVEHRYQMELVEPLWPRLGKLWVAEAQRLRERLGSHQDLVVLAGLTAPHQPLAPWRSRVAPLIDQRRAVHAAAAQRLAHRIFAERPKAFRRRLEALWNRLGG
jgi:CHAD domain-containing protein